MAEKMIIELREIIAKQVVIIEEQKAEIEQLKTEIKSLKEQLKQNSTNSSKPPSSDGFKKQTSLKKKGGKVGGQDGHKGYGMKIDKEPDKIVELKSERCDNCGADLIFCDSEFITHRYVYEVVIKSILIEYQQFKTVCGSCETSNFGEFPKNVNGTKQYGESVAALAALLTNYAMVGIDKTAKIMRDVLCVPISTGTIDNINKRFSKSKITGDISAKIKDVLSLSKVVHFDETGLRVDGKNHWLHTSSNADVTYNTVHKKRGKTGIDNNGIINEFAGVAVHDCMKTYFGYDNCEHALCCAHLLRELNASIENDGFQWAADMKKLLLDMKRKKEKYIELEKSKLSSHLHRKYDKEYERIIALGNDETPYNIASRKQSKARNLLDRFISYKAEVCRFANDFDVPFDNNQAERDIRFVKVKQKVSGGFRSEYGADNFAISSSVIGTAVKQKKSVFYTVKDIFLGVNSLFAIGATE